MGETADCVYSCRNDGGTIGKSTMSPYKLTLLGVGLLSFSLGEIIMLLASAENSFALRLFAIVTLGLSALSGFVIAAILASKE
jgi:hypothetical protein